MPGLPPPPPPTAAEQALETISRSVLAGGIPPAPEAQQALAQAVGQLTRATVAATLPVEAAFGFPPTPAEITAKVMRRVLQMIAQQAGG